MRQESNFSFASIAFSLVLVACAQGGDDDTQLPVFNPDASTVLDSGPLRHDGSVPHDAPSGFDGNQPGDDSGPTGDDASTGDDSSTGDDGGIDSSPGVDASDSGSTTDSGSVTAPAQGEILVTEVMFNPSTTEPNTEWFEVYNAASGPRQLQGLTITDGSGNSDTIATSVVVQPGAYVTFINKLGAGSPTVPQSSIAYAYSGLQFANSNSASNVKLASGATTIAQAPYGGFSSTIKASGSSVQLQSLTFADESVSGSWCKSTLTWSGSADKGTPGAAAKCQ